MRILSLFTLALLAFSLPAASAASSSVHTAGNCGIVTDPACWTIHFACYMTRNDTTGDCTHGITNRPASQAALATNECGNYGVLVQVTATGGNDYCAGDSCTNEGVIILLSPLGQSMWCNGASGTGVVCVQDICQVILPQPGVELASSATRQDDECSNSGIVAVMPVTGSGDCCPSTAGGVAACVEQDRLGGLSELA